MLTLKGRTCVFAGAAGQIGQGAVRALAAQGMNVIMVTHNPASAAAIVDSLKDLPGTVMAMSNENSDAAIFAETEKRFGSVDVIINSTGGLMAPVKPEEISGDMLDRKLHHQVTAVYGMVRDALPFLRRSRAGRIILVATAGAVDGFSGECIADSIARGGILSMTCALARALAPDGITVNCIARSGMINDHPPKGPEDLDVKDLLAQIPVGRAGTADEFGAAVEYAASEEAGFVTGHIFNLTGGLHIG